MSEPRGIMVGNGFCVVFFGGCWWGGLFFSIGR